MNFGKRGIAEKEKAISAKKTRKKKKSFVIALKIVLVGFLCVGAVGACFAAGAIRGILASAPSIDTIDVSPSGFATTVYDSAGNETTQLVSSGSNRVYVTIDQIPDCVQDAFVAIEDSRFWEHNGIDIKGILRAGIRGVTTGHFSEGASTLTQQLIKNNVFTDWTSESGFGDKIKRKIQEQYLAVQLEKTVDKDWILENYLNTINLGQNTLGVEAASERYFNKDVSDLTISEAAVIAAITQNPSYYNPVTNPENNATRREKVLTNMMDQGYITEDEYNEALADDVYSRIQLVDSETESSVYSYFVDELTEQVISDLMEEKGYSEAQAYKLLYSGGLSIYTTQDPDIQSICDEEYSDESNYPSDVKYSFTLALTIQHTDGTLSNYDDNTMLSYLQKNVSSDSKLLYDSEEEALAAIHEYEAAIMVDGDTIVTNGEVINYTLQPQASIVIMDQSTGEVKAIVGGRGEKEASLTLNRATNTFRQPGSTFKIVSTYAPALDVGGFTLASVQDDAPYSYSNGTSLKNYDNNYRGFTTLREAITDSINVVTVKTLTDITPQLGYDYLLDFGFTSLQDSDIVQSLALGGITKGVTDLELTAAYATIANGGTYTEPIFYTKILDHDGNVLIDNTPETHQVLKSTTAFLLTDAMEDVVTSGTGTAVNFGTTPIAGKTGTTTGNVDSWFVGYTAYYTCGVWGGYDHNGSMTSTSFTKTLWKNVMSRIHENLEYKDFTVPDGIVTAQVCSKSGKLPIEGVCDNDPRGSTVITEYFAEGTVPTDYCDHHVSATICADSGQIANEYCPNKIVQTFIIGGSADAGDSAYLLTDEMAANVCTLHNSQNTSTSTNTTGTTDTDDSTTNSTNENSSSSTHSTTTTHE